MPNDKPFTPDAAPLTKGAAPTDAAMEDVFFDEDSGIYASPNGLQMLRPSDLPSPLSEVVANAPMNRRAGSFFAAATALATLATRIRCRYYHNSFRLHALLLQTIVEGPQSCGKSFVADIENLIMGPTLRKRDAEQRKLEMQYAEKKRRRANNKELPEEPKTTVRCLPATVSKTRLLSRSVALEMSYNEQLTFWQFGEELSQVSDSNKRGFSDLRTILRTAYDLGSLWGQDYFTSDSCSAIVDLILNSLYCATPSAVDYLYDNKAILGGDITRTIIVTLEDSPENDTQMFIPYTPEQQENINRTLQRIMDDCYLPDGHIQPTKLIDMSWIDRECKIFIARKATLFSKVGKESVNVFRKRSSVSAFRIATLCYYLFSISMGFDPTLSEGDEKARKYCRRIYRFCAEYIYRSMMHRWGERFDQLNAKGRCQEPKTQTHDSFFDSLPDVFDRNTLQLTMKEHQIVSPARQFIWLWSKRLHLIEEVGPNQWRKIKK